jgi:hypothetical protein
VLLPAAPLASAASRLGPILGLALCAGLLLPASPADAGPASGNPGNAIAVYYPLVQSTQLVCVDAPSQVCEIQLDRIEDPETLVESRQVRCTSETCANPCPATGQQLCRPQLITDAGGDLIQLRGTMTVTSSEEDLGGGDRRLTVTASAVFPASLNPLPADLAIEPQIFSQSFTPNGSCAAGDGNQTGPGVVARDSDAILAALLEYEIDPGDTPLVGWFPLEANACVLDDVSCNGAPGFDFDGMIVPFGAARTALSQAAKTAYPLETVNVDPVPLMVSVTRSSGKRTAITAVQSACVPATEIGAPGPEQTNRYEVVVRFSLPRGTAPPKLCDANRDGFVERPDIDEILASLGSAALPPDVRDANDDGTISILDARTCALMCETADCQLEVAQTQLPGRSQAVALSRDVLVSGNWTDGLVEVYRLVGDTWQKEATLRPPTGGLGLGRGLDVDRDTIVVGSEVDERAYVHQFNPNTICSPTTDACWPRRRTLQAEGPVQNGDFGFSVSIAGDAILIGAPSYTEDSRYPEGGMAFAFRRSSAGAWPFIPTHEIEPLLPTAYGGFGFSVDVARRFPSLGRPEGYPTYVIGAPYTNVGFPVGLPPEGAVQIDDSFVVTSGGPASGFVQPTSVNAFKLGYAVAMDSDGTLVMGTAGRQVFVFEYAPMPYPWWQESQVLTTSSSTMYSAAVSGDRFAMGFFPRSPIEIFAFRSGAWVRDLVLSPSDPTGAARFYEVMDLEGDRLAASSLTGPFVFELID